MKREKASAQDWEQWNDVLFALYQGMPAGAVLLDRSGAVLSSNQKMRLMFPPLSDSPSLGGLLRCPCARCGSESCGAARDCKSCPLWKGLREIFRHGRTIPETEIRRVDFLKSHRRVR